MIKEKEAEIKTKKAVPPLVRKFVSDMVTRWVKGIEKVGFVSEEEKGKAAETPEPESVREAVAFDEKKEAQPIPEARQGD
jgi:hypothetical protein